jgi:hypothetical protein
MRMRISSAAALAVALLLGALLVTQSVWALCAPSVKGIFPASGLVGTSVAATVTGDDLAGATASVFGEPGLSVNVTTTSATSVSLQLTIDPAAAPGERIISLTTSAGTVAVDFTVNPAGGPIVSGVAPAAIATQGFPLALVVSGQNLAGITTSNVTVSGAGVTVDTATAAGDGTSVNLGLLVAADADLGTHALVFSTPLGGALLELYVQRPAPTITQISPGAGAVGTVVPLTITGAHLTGAALVITSGASGQGGVSISQVATPDDSTLTATLTISGTLTAESEPRQLIVTNEAGQSTAEFFVVAATGPTITSIAPGAGSPGQTVTNVVLRGLHLTGATVTTSAALTPQNVTVLDDETIQLDVAVSAGATVNTNYTITATVGAASANITFRVIATNAPYISAVRPPFANRGDTATIVLEGVNLATVVPGTGVNVSSSGIVESNTSAIDDHTVRTIFSLSPTANVGKRDITVTTSHGSYTANSSFRVNIPGQVPTITDVTPLVVAPGATTSITVTGSNFAGAGVSVGGPGAVVSDIVVDAGATTVTFDLTLSSDASAENRPLIVVTENGTATCDVLSLAPPIELSAAKLEKTGAVFEALTPGYRLFLFEFSMNERFDQGLRTCTVASGTARLALSRRDAERIGRAVRDLPFGYVRVRAVTATNQIGASVAHRFER